MPASKTTLWLDAHALSQGMLARAPVRLPVDDDQAIRAAAGPAIAPPYIVWNCRPGERSDASAKERSGDWLTVVADHRATSELELDNAANWTWRRIRLLASPMVHAP